MSRFQKHSALGKADFSFRERALAEAARYGSDSWVFLRELLQNARDAGAGRVEFRVAESADTESLTCRDDGCGMSAVHAHHYLFALYASSKESNRRQAGQFGVGFWSVLRFKPDKVVIRSRPRGGEAWQVELSHRLENAVFTSCNMEAGTEIVLVRHRRPDRGDDKERPRLSAPRRRPLEERVYDAVWHYGRFLTRCRTGRGLFSQSEAPPIRITVNGRSANAEMKLPAPSSSFRRRGFARRGTGEGFRGVVALGSEPRVELFANGLFVRRAPCLEDLLEESPKDELEEDKSSLDLPGSLAPQVLLDSSDLEPLLARSEVRQTRHLRHLVSTAERELERLIERQLEAVRPLPWFLPLWARLRGLCHRLGGSRRFRRAGWIAPLVAAGVLLGWLLAGWTVRDRGEVPWKTWEGTLPAFRDTLYGELPFGRGGFVGDLGASYVGPRLDPLVASSARAALSYRPADQELYLSALVVENPDTWTSVSGRELGAAGPYEGTSCPPAGAGCVTIRLTAAEGDLRLPVPTGHLLDPDSVRRNGSPQSVWVTGAGEPLVRGLRQGDDVEYRTAPARASVTGSPGSSPLPIPLRISDVAGQLVGVHTGERVASALEHVRRLVAYDRSAEAVRQHRAEMAAGHGFAQAALTVGKGDCDVQNGILVMLLREAGVSARLAVGYVGQEGRATPGLHAWAEYLDEDRRWQIADVSEGLAPAGTSPLLWVRGSSRESDDGRASPLAASLDGGDEAGEAGGLGELVSRLLGDPGRWRIVGTGSLFLSTALALSWVALARRRSSCPATVKLADTELAALLGGALQHPGLARLPALAHGRFIPLIEGPRPLLSNRRRAISLHEAQRRAAAGELFSSAAGSHLAREAAARGRLVLDASQPEGRVAALGLGAVDLDEWSDLLDRATSSALVRHLNEYLGSIGEDWRLALASPLAQQLKVVDLARLGLGRRQVLIDPRSADFAVLGPRLGLASDSVAFRLLDAMADHLDLTRHDQARILSELARRAVVERHGPLGGDRAGEHSPPGKEARGR